MNIFIQTITELFLDRESFLNIYSPTNKAMKFIEFFCILLGSFSLSVAAIFVNPPFSSGYFVLIVFMTIANYFFLSFVSSILSYGIDFRAKELIKSGDFPSLNASARCLNIIFIMACPIAIILNFIGVNSFSAYFSILVVTISAYIWIFSGFANEIYEMGKYRTFKSAVSSAFFILYIPFMILFYIIMNLSVIL